MEVFQISPALMERVDAGAEWADENLPGWRDIINRDILDMAWEETCILGQYHFYKYGDTKFVRAMHAHFGDDTDRAIELGFLDLNFDYTALTAAWKLKLNEKEAQG